MRIIFMGTPEFSVPALESIIADGHEVVAVFTQPDKPKGRHFKLTPPPVKVCAAAHGIPVFQPTSLKDEEIIKTIKDFEPDCIVVVAYGRLLPVAVLEIPRFGCINVHASLLPRYRGAAPIQWAVINGEKQTGVTTMHMAKGLDTGDMILKKQTEIGADETYGELHDRLKIIGAKAICETLPLLENGKAPRINQDDALSNYASMIDKEKANIDWQKSGAEIHNLVRGMNPHPAAHTFLDGKMFKIYRTKLAQSGETIKDKDPGTIVFVGNEGFDIVCGDGKLLTVTEVQAQGGKRMAAADYARGHGIKAGIAFKTSVDL